MIRKLRIKLILASMFSLLMVLTIIFGAVGILNYKKILTDADSVLAILEENDGNFPVGKHPGDEFFWTGPRKAIAFSLLSCPMNPDIFRSF